ncbi:MAG: hypothetical protein GWN07_11600, partial [Actinobacteria bacterium]|nr:hypothetical protein [Actinomycetota bacterium]NIS30954.1 hypothetical protein [Actinomycetota bacterium]NIU66134.1 hypothetical protein [Actinomycetota bacterium]NIV86956.1 hypothetical protein [Actinomycetota bacterium]NIW27935.1 hypothetical protein [Actinomycetota bacterium]
IGDACLILDGDGDGWDDRLGVSGGGCAAGGPGDGGGLALLLLLALFGIRRRGVAIALVVALGWPVAADAQAPAVERQDFSVERFRLATDRGGILDVEWAAVPGHLQAQAALWIGYADDPLVLYRRDPDGNRERVAPLVDHRTTGSAVFALPLFDIISVGFELPVVLHQSRPSLGLDEGLRLPAGNLRSAGFGDLRLVTKVQLLQAQRHGIDLAVMPV